MSRELPQQFVALMEGYGAPAITGPLLGALANTEPSVAVRANSRRGAELSVDGTRVPWLAGSGAYLDRRPNFALDPAWHQGRYYVQDASSMVMTHVVKTLISRYFSSAPVRYLDACAAPGGKSIAAAEALPDGSVLLSNEYDPRRAAVLVENMAKYGMAASAVSRGDTAVLGRLGEVFDIVAVDAPCSGEGMMRKEPEAIAQWTLSLVEQCAALQRKILADCWKALRPGGVMIYSTCTFNRVEDEQNLQYVIDELGGESLDLHLDQFPGVARGIATDAYCYRFMPGHIRGEGLFIAAVMKRGGENGEFSSKHAKGVSLQKIKSPEVEAFMRRALRGDFSARMNRDGSYYAVPVHAAPFLDYLASRLNLLSAGVELCLPKGRDLIPAWQLAFCEDFNTDSLPQMALNRLPALQYLHGEGLAEVPDGMTKGFATVTYQGQPLGFVKNIGRRANNLYPDALRLRLDPARGIDNDYLPIVR